MRTEANLESKTQNCLDQLELALKVSRMPGDNPTRHVDTWSNCILIHDRDEAETWLTFEHEVYGYKFKEVALPHRSLVNSLIEAGEKLAYERKERFLDFLPRAFKAIVGLK